ncbi:MAG: 1,2-phenylacetyl-CoA epoxidase subunit PaaC, partial [Bacteroidota bacterium]
MNNSDKLHQYLLQLGDNTLILGQRLSSWCGHGPVLEVDMALTNIALDLLGQTRSYFQYAAEVGGEGLDEDKLAFMRDIRQYRNVLLVEQENGDFAHTIVRQFFFDTWHLHFLEALQRSRDARVAAIAEKSLKEVKYHYRFSREWLVRLGDGTPESKVRTQAAVDKLWIFIGELCMPTELDQEVLQAGIGVDLEVLEAAYMADVSEALAEATLFQPEEKPF